MNAENKKEKTKKVVTNLLKTDRGKAIIFFLFYGVFFFIIILMARAGFANKSKNEVVKEQKVNISSNYDFTKLETGNYRFTREEDRNGVKTIFTGDVNDGKSSFIMTQDNTVRTFFSYNDIFLERINNTYNVAVNPYLYSSLNDVKNIKNIIKTAHLKAKTTYENGNTVYQYEITSNSLIELLDNKQVDLDDAVNLIDLTTSGDKEIIEITYHLDNYHSYTYSMIEKLTIKIDYSDYGKVKELEIPG